MILHNITSALRHSCLAIAVALAALCAAGSAHAQELYGQRSSLFAMLKCDSTSIVMLGNSLTHGCEWHELFANPHILNRGINGDTAQGILDRLEPIVAGKPAKIFLLTGVNDVSHDLSADSVVTAICKVIDTIRLTSPATRLYVQSLLPINNAFGRYKRLAGKEQTIRDINALLEPKVHAAGATWINLYPAFCDAEGNLRSDLTNDGLHLLAPGYAIWHDILLPYISE